MKKIVLCVDSLEYNLVQKYNLAVYKQKKYSKIKVPILPEDGIPTTSVVWPSFMRGKLSRKSERSFKDTMATFIKNRLPKLPFYPEFSYFMRRKGWSKFEFERDPHMKTVFPDHTKIISMPKYNEDLVNDDLRLLIYETLNGFYSKATAETLAVHGFHDKIRRTWEALEKSDFVVVHYFVLDVIQHLFYNDEKRVMKHYLMVAREIKRIQQKYKDALIVIVSDHGQKNGIHTKYGFFSSNKDLKIRNPDIITLGKKIADF